MATPAIVGDRLLIRTQHRLYSIRNLPNEGDDDGRHRDHGGGDADADCRPHFSSRGVVNHRERLKLLRHVLNQLGGGP